MQAMTGRQGAVHRSARTSVPLLSRSASVPRPGEWVAGIYGREGNPTVVRSGYATAYEAKSAADKARQLVIMKARTDNAAAHYALDGTNRARSDRWGR